MRRFNIFHVLLLIGSAAILVSPVFFDKKKSVDSLYVLDSAFIALGAFGGLLSSGFNFRRGKPWSQPWSRVDVFGGLISVLYWMVTGACVGGTVGFLGMIGIALIAGVAILTLVCLPLLLLIPVVALAMPILAFASVPVLILLMDVRNT